MMATTPAFDIFSGRFGKKGVVWLGAIERLDDARARGQLGIRPSIRFHSGGQRYDSGSNLGYRKP